MSPFSFNGEYKTQLLYILILPAFFLGSVLLYNQFDIKAYYTFGTFDISFHLTMMFCIIFLCALVSRTLLFFILKHNNFTWMNYLAWCIGEMFAMSAFITLYTILFKGNGTKILFELMTIIKFVFLTLCYPYAIMTLVRVAKIKDVELSNKDKASDNSLVRFYDEHKRLKLSIAPSSILYVSSEVNYVKIHYLDAGKVREFMLRASMKSLEDTNSRCLVRCQRSYFVNPEHITVLRKNAEGFIFAEMNIPEVPAVPVSKQYYDALADLL